MKRTVLEILRPSNLATDFPAWVLKWNLYLCACNVHVCSSSPYASLYPKTSQLPNEWRRHARKATGYLLVRGCKPGERLINTRSCPETAHPFLFPLNKAGEVKRETYRLHRLCFLQVWTDRLKGSRNKLVITHVFLCEWPNWCSPPYRALVLCN